MKYVDSELLITTLSVNNPHHIGANATWMALPPTRAAAHGKGRAVLEASGDEAVFSALSYRYPLKLLSPQTIGSKVPLAIAYMLSYGGGLVSGDRIDLDVEVGSNSSLMLLTQVQSSHRS